MERKVQEIFIGLTTLDIQRLQDEMAKIHSSWNGKDTEFQFGGIVYREEDVHIAGEIATKCGDILGLLENFI